MMYMGEQRFAHGGIGTWIGTSGLVIQMSCINQFVFCCIAQFCFCIQDQHTRINIAGGSQLDSVPHPLGEPTYKPLRAIETSAKHTHMGGRVGCKLKNQSMTEASHTAMHKRIHTAKQSQTIAQANPPPHLL